MLTKALQFDDDVCSVLRGMRWADDGKLGVIVRQLDRPLYERVNKALTAMGGKWNRKAGGHVFPLDPRPSVAGLLESGSLTVERDGFFETPREVVARMVELVYPQGNVLEPSAGLGAIADQLPILRDRIMCVEKNPQRVEVLRAKGYVTHCGDFLEYSLNRYDTIYMNPPFEQGQDIDHVRHAHSLLRGQMVAVMSEGPFFRSDRKAVRFREWLEEVGGWSEKLPDGAFRESGTMVNARLVVIEK